MTTLDSFAFGDRLRGGRGGVAVKPGVYTVTLGKLAGTNFTPLGQPQKVEVVPLETSNR